MEINSSKHAFIYIHIIIHLCRDDDDARLLRLAPGLPELRELEFEELWAQKEARGGGWSNTHTHTCKQTGVYAQTQVAYTRTHTQLRRTRAHSQPAPARYQ